MDCPSRPSEDRTQILCTCTGWACAILLTLTPIATSLDFGGVLPWTQYLAAFVLSIAVAFQVCQWLSGAANGQDTSPQLTSTLPALLIFGLAAFALLTTLPLPASLVSLLSPMRASIAERWLAPFEETSSTWMSISIGPTETLHAAALLLILAAVCFVATDVFASPHRAMLLMLGIGLYGTVIAIVGSVRNHFPSFAMWSFQAGGEGAPFGTFLNRNNAALGMNLGLAAATGILFERLHQFDSLRQQGQRFLTASKVFLLSPTTIFAVVALVTCVAGLAGCGSRGGLIAMMAAGLITPIVMRRFTRMAYVIAAVSLTGLVAVLFSPSSFRIDLQTVHEQLATDARWSHWPDGFRAAWHSLPLGSGFGTYAYAYLPWQESSPWRWFVHAENLWLELLVETSLFGLFAIAVMFGLVRVAIRRLCKSENSIDHAYATGGVYLLISVAVSQCFDFGLLVPSNLLIAGLLVSVLWSRANPGIGSADSVRNRSNRGAVAVTAIVSMVTLFAIVQLNRDSVADSAARVIEHHLEHDPFAPDRLSELSDLSQTYRSTVERHPTSRLLNAYTNLEFERGRLTEMKAFGSDELPELGRELLYATTSKTCRRIAWRNSLSPRSLNSRGGLDVSPIPTEAVPTAAMECYHRALRYNLASLRSRPLSIEPRFNWVAMEFVHQNPYQTDLALEQSAQLFKNSANVQLNVGTAFADHADFRKATRAFRRAADISPDRTNVVLGKAKRYPAIPLEKLIPTQLPTRMVSQSQDENQG